MSGEEWRSKVVLHTSGALDERELSPLAKLGASAGSMHPLQTFSGRASTPLDGVVFAIQGDPRAQRAARRIARALGGFPVSLRTGAKPAYHAAAVLAAGGFDALLDAIAELGRLAGLDEAGSLAVYGPLIEQTLGNARALGIDRALTGPATRGDRGTIRAHLAELEARAPDVAALYARLADREIGIAERRGSLTPEAASDLRSAADPALARPD